MKTAAQIAGLGLADLIVLAEEPGVILPTLTLALSIGLPWMGYKLGRRRTS